MLTIMKKSQEVLEGLLSYLKISANKLSSEIGLTANTSIYHIKNGRNGISPDLANKIVDRYPEINYIWLLTGEGEMIEGEMEQSIASEPAPEYGMDFLIKENQFLKQQILNKDQEIERLWNLFEKGSKKAV
jgi:hypothetical protein